MFSILRQAVKIIHIDVMKVNTGEAQIDKFYIFLTIMHLL